MQDNLMLSENKEYDIDDLLNIDSISPNTLKILKNQVYGQKSKKEKLEDKISSFEKSVNKAKDDNKLRNDYTILGLCFLVLGRIDDALDAFSNVKSKKNVSFFIGKCYQELGKYKEALEYFEQSQNKDVKDNDYCVQIEIASTKRKCGDAKGAKQIIKSILKDNSEDADLHYQLGHCLDDLGENSKAFECYERAVELDPNHAQSLFRMAYNYDLNQMENKAIELYEKCNDLPIKYVNSFLNLGILYDDKGEHEEAIACFNTVLKSDPNNLRAQMFLKDVKMSLNMYYDDSNTKKENKTEDVMSMPISEFELSVRSRNCLEKMSINTLGDLTRVNEMDLLSYKNFGETSLYEIRNVLKQKGLRLGQTLEESPDNKVVIKND